MNDECQLAYQEDKISLMSSTITNMRRASASSLCVYVWMCICMYSIASIAKYLKDLDILKVLLIMESKNESVYFFSLAITYSNTYSRLTHSFLFLFLSFIKVILERRRT